MSKEQQPMTAEEYYVSYYKLDPNEDLHNEALDYIMCMKEFAAQQCAEKDKQIEAITQQLREANEEIENFQSLVLFYKTGNLSLIDRLKTKGMKPLQLTLKKKWFDMILSGEKTEEYREIKSYWISRLCERHNSSVISGGDIINRHNGVNYSLKKFNKVIFKNGYSKNAPSFEIECLTIEIGKPVGAWSDNWQGEVFIIKLGKIINP